MTKCAYVAINLEYGTESTIILYSSIKAMKHDEKDNKFTIYSGYNEFYSECTKEEFKWHMQNLQYANFSYLDKLVYSVYKVFNKIKKDK